MKRCRHLQDYLIEPKAIGPNTGLPPFIALCEDCAAAASEALKSRIDAIGKSGCSGKSSRAQIWAWYRRVHQDINKDPMETIGHDVQLVASHEAKLQQEKFGPKD